MRETEVIGQIIQKPVGKEANERRESIKHNDNSSVSPDEPRAIDTKIIPSNPSNQKKQIPDKQCKKN